MIRCLARMTILLAAATFPLSAQERASTVDPFVPFASLRVLGAVTKAASLAEGIPSEPTGLSSTIVFCK